MFRSIRWKLIVTNLLAIGLPLAILSFVLLTTLWSFYLDQLKQELTTKARVLADSAAPILSPKTPNDRAALADLVERWRAYTEMGLTIVDVHGIIQASSVAEEVGTPITESLKPGLADAIRGKTNSTVWKSPNFDYQDTMYVNLPLHDGIQAVGAARVAYSLRQVQDTVGPIRRTVMISLAIYAILIVLLTLWQADSIVRPIESLNAGARKIAAGDLDYTVEVSGTSEVRNLAETLNQTAKRLGTLEGMRRTYVANVSHELRTPLAAIRGMAETIIQYGDRDPALLQRYLPRIVSHTDRLARLASQLLDLAQIESGNLTAAFAPVSLEEIVDDALSLVAVRAEAKGVSLSTEIAPGVPTVPGDRDRLVQAVVNLVDNAIRHTNRGGTVRIEVERMPRIVRLSVRDTGSGIPAEHLPHVFDRFYRVDEARTRSGGGTGLGLSIVKQIVSAHAGEITLESHPGAGSRFTIELPCEPERDASTDPDPGTSERAAASLPVVRR